MITRITEKEELEAALSAFSPDVFTGKIKALYEAYGFSYPFLKFFRSERAVIAFYYASAVICGEADEEISQFCSISGITDLLISHGGSPDSILYILQYVGGGSYADLKTDAPYEKVYNILKDGFQIDFESWYTDTCHNVRHGISEIYTLEDAATATKMFSIDGIALLSLVAVKKEHRKRNYGRRIIEAAAERLSPENRVFVICEKELVPFYKKCGFEKTAECYNEF